MPGKSYNIHHSADLLLWETVSVSPGVPLVVDAHAGSLTEVLVPGLGSESLFVRVAVRN